MKFHSLSNVAFELVQRHRVACSRPDSLRHAGLVVLTSSPVKRMEVEVDAVQLVFIGILLVLVVLDSVRIVGDVAHLLVAAAAFAHDVFHDAVTPALLPLRRAADHDCCTKDSLSVAVFFRCFICLEARCWQPM